jgi:hypothetical protein
MILYFHSPCKKPLPFCGLPTLAFHVKYSIPHPHPQKYEDLLHRELFWKIPSSGRLRLAESDAELGFLNLLFNNSGFMNEVKEVFNT